jgi:hypothetical protein
MRINIPARLLTGVAIGFVDLHQGWRPTFE